MSPNDFYLRSPSTSPSSKTVAIVMASFGLSPLLSTALLQTVGCNETDDAEALAALPEEEIPNIAKDMWIGEKMRPPTYFEKKRRGPSTCVF